MKRLIAIFMMFCLVLGMSSVSVFAGVGELSSKPEDGWKRMIGTEFLDNITRTGVWTDPQSGVSYNPSAAYTFKFKGDKIRFLIKYHNSSACQALHVRIDGKDYYSQQFTQFSEVRYLAIEVLDLSDSIHNVEVLGTYADSSHNFFPNAIDIPVEATLIGKTIPLKISVLLNKNEEIQLSTYYELVKNANFTWSSANEAVATVDSNGKVTAIGVGDADIYAESADGTFKEYIPVKVVEGIADE
ncbi:Ig-like domain-containing protein, partial [Aminipila sp.]|uniref:Ig-like domain-containing protein n=1 Tax=Aminipila sp. TaxID=2060095 RepID=UPI00289C7430